jgi:hypothetical protein
MDDPASWPLAAIPIVAAVAGIRALRLVVRRRRSHDQDRQIISQLRARVGDVRDAERDDHAKGRELGT